MNLWRRIGQQRWAQVTLGVIAAEYVRFVGKTTRLTIEPPDAFERAEPDLPVIVAFWHGQHLLATNARKPEHRVKMLVSRHRDGEVNAIAAQRLGVGTIRGSGNHVGGFVHKGGVAAFQGMLDALREGYSVALSADVPKVSRKVGLGIIKLAQMSGRPIYGIAIATHHRIVLNNWDRDDQPAVQPRRRRAHGTAARRRRRRQRGTRSRTYGTRIAPQHGHATGL
jgi:lysophospholipid acyltransferase (LPLAT)-like uncharacterized protein